MGQVEVRCDGPAAGGAGQVGCTVVRDVEFIRHARGSQCRLVQALSTGQQLIEANLQRPIVTTAGDGLHFVGLAGERQIAGSGFQGNFCCRDPASVPDRIGKSERMHLQFVAHRSQTFDHVADDFVPGQASFL